MRPSITAFVVSLIFFAGTLNAQQSAPSSKDARANSVDLPGRDTVTRSMERTVLRALARKNVWDGPKSGPPAQTGKSIALVVADMRNDGAVGVLKGAEQAAQVMGWSFKSLDGQGTAQARTAALKQALALNPKGLAIIGFDADEQAAALAEASRRRIPVVGWHSGAQPDGIPGLFYNVTTPALQVAEIAALYAVTESRGKAGVVILTDSRYSAAIAKSDAMAAIIKACKGCALLSVEDAPLSEVSKRMPKLAAELGQRFGSRWTYTLAINDLYFDHMPSSSGANDPLQRPLVNLSAGDGSTSAYVRIRSGGGQAATVPEPLNLHGWQIIDELNRAMAGQPPSGYSTPVHLVTQATIVFDGGPRNIFDPDNGYRERYKTIWKK